MSPSVTQVLSGMVNAYLVKGEGGFVLVDTGMPNHRAGILKALDEAGCRPGDLRLIIVTHGDADHSGNASVFRERFGAKIAMHRAETAAVEQGDMFLSRGPVRGARRLMKPLMGLFRLRKADRFTPDLFLEDGDRLDDHGLAAAVFHVPGHSTGSIAVLTDEGDLFCGDFLENRRKPSIATLVDDRVVLRTSFDRLQGLEIRRVYPGHGNAFEMGDIA